MDEEKVVTFEDALRAAQEQMQAGEPVEGQPQAEEQGVVAEQAVVPEVAGNPQLEQPVAPQPTPQQPDPQTMQMMAQMQQLQQQNQQLQQMLQELSQRNQDTVVEEALTPPTLDISGLWSEDENIIAQKQAEYAQKMAEYTKKQLMSEISPFLETAKQGMVEKERMQAMEGLSQVPELSGIMGMTPTLERIISSNPALANSDAPIEDKLITAYAIAKGAEAIKTGMNPPKEPGIDDFLAMYSQNPDLQKRIEQIRAKNAAESVAEVPPMSASTGAFNAALTVQDRPTDFEEAKRQALSRLGI